jgi:hypothetical protein
MTAGNSLILMWGLKEVQDTRTHELNNVELLHDIPWESIILGSSPVVSLLNKNINQKAPERQNSRGYLQFVPLSDTFKHFLIFIIISELIDSWYIISELIGLFRLREHNRMLQTRIVLAVIMIFPVFLYGQDSIYKNDNSVIACYIQEWNDSIVQYIPIEKPNSEIHFLSVFYVDSIRFQNGQLEEFNSLGHPDAGTPQRDRKNYFGIGLIDPVVYTNLRLSYEHRSGTGSVGLFIPVTIGFEHEQYFTERGVRFRIGLGMNFHVPRKKGPSFYAVGLGVYYGRYFLHPLYSDDRQAHIDLTNSHSFRIRITDSIVLAPGVDFNLIGWFKRYGVELLYPFPYSFRLDFLVNL